MLGYLENLANELDTAALVRAAERVAAVFLCLTVHETSHGLAALALGDPTAKAHNRLSLNPLRHIDWLGLALMFTAGFGWAKPVPVDPRYFKHPKSGMAITALAGPVSNFILAAVSLGLARLMVPLLQNNAAAWEGVFRFFAVSLPVLSIGLGVFNLIPFPPLDGSKVTAALLPDRVYMVWMRYERFGMLILLLLVVIGGFGDSFLSMAVNGVYFALTYVIFAGLI